MKQAFKGDEFEMDEVSGLEIVQTLGRALKTLERERAERAIFEETALATIQAQGFLLTAIVRGQLKEMSPEEADEAITLLLRQYASVELPDNVRTDEETLRAISKRHEESQSLLKQMLEFARPR